MVATPQIQRKAALLYQATPQPAPPLDRLMTTTEVARFLMCSNGWLEGARSRGEGPHFLRLSRRRIRYRWSDVERWLGQFASSPSAPVTTAPTTKPTKKARTSSRS